VDSPPPVEAVAPVSVLSPPVSDDPRALPALYRIASVGARTDDPRSALQIILLELSGLFHATCGSIALLSPDTGRLEIEIQQGLPLDSGRYRPSPRPGRHRLGRFPRACATGARCHRRPALHFIEGGRPVRNGGPMEANGQIIASSTSTATRLDGFSASDLALLERLTVETTPWWQRLWQLRQLQGKARQLETLITIGQSLGVQTRAQELFDTVTREARQIIGLPSLCALPARCCQGDRATGLRVVAGAADFASAAGSAPLPAGHLPLDHCLIASVLHAKRQIEFQNLPSPEYADVIDLRAVTVCIDAGGPAAV